MAKAATGRAKVQVPEGSGTGKVGIKVELKNMTQSFTRKKIRRSVERNKTNSVHSDSHGRSVRSFNHVGIQSNAVQNLTIVQSDCCRPVQICSGMNLRSF